MVQPKTVTLWQTYKKSTTTLVCATASRNRDSDGDGACRLLGTVTMARQLTSQMLAETRQTSKRLSRTRRRGCGRREPAARSGPTARGTAPTATSGRRAPPARMGRAAIAREPAEGPARADADPVRHRGSCPGGEPAANAAVGSDTPDRKSTRLN